MNSSSTRAMEAREKIIIIATETGPKYTIAKINNTRNKSCLDTFFIKNTAKVLEKERKKINSNCVRVVLKNK